jgi:hypothetical protein
MSTGLYTLKSQANFTHKENTMKIQRILFLLAIGIGVGTAMGVALNDVSVGIALGVAAVAAFARQKSSSPESK